MSHMPFVYDNGLVTECAKSKFATRLVSGGKVTVGSLLKDDTVDVIDTSAAIATAASCVRLFEQHALHFGRRPVNKNVEEEEDGYSYETRLNNFVHNVVFVHNHNNAGPFRVGLNQFSDSRLNQILPDVEPENDDVDHDDDDEEKDKVDEPLPHTRHHHHHNRRKHRNRWLEAAMLKAQNRGSNNKDVFDMASSTANFTLFSSLEHIMDVANAYNLMAMSSSSSGGRGLVVSGEKRGGLQPLSETENQHHEPKVTLKDFYLPVSDGDHYDLPKPFQAGPDVSANHKSGFLLSIKNKNNNNNIKQGDNHKNGINNDHNDDDDIPVPGVTIGGLDDHDRNDFTTYLNWATSDNPDGVPLVHEPIDQGACGSCWAYVAAGSVEASAARSAALDAYQGFKSHSSSSSSGRRNGSSNSNNNNKVNIKTTPLPPAAAAAALDDDDVEALTNARRVEHDAMKLLNLSIQELIDCDTQADEGCIGGNPILAFYFIHRYGLVSWEQYPYVAKEKTCKSEWTRDPLATVQSWGILTPNHESQMELVLRYIGPVAVGLNGGADTFLSYSGGVYSNPTCKHGANHAMLVVGYGQETDSRTGHVTKYWIARNSWGKGWGENGFVRIARSQGKGGVCGLEKSPSVALGGVLVGNHGLDKYRNDASSKRRDYGIRQSSMQQYSGNAHLENTNNNPSLAIFCERMGFGTDSSCVQLATWLPQHKPLCFGLSAMVCFAMAVWFLTMDGRAQGRRLRQRHGASESSADSRGATHHPLSDASLSPHETSPLLNAASQSSYTVPIV